ncbi:hypothetical protein [Rhizohabitans arisaemae]|uniref:hypothetical protein n=1 Tax=Rhizohabitans arisaemae TaxID=2720610 RepID=UPI0024B1476F|nr:hypothetical protein [Rhizohabitans arisaemae]
MNGPHHDDSGLPPIHIEIPDDARELEPEVRAYQRELRHRRRADRLRHLRERIGVKGPIGPIVATVALLIAISATMLITFTPKQGNPVTTTRTGQKPPDLQLRMGASNVWVRHLRPAVLFLVPPDCRCDPVIDDLRTQAHAEGIPFYLVTRHPLSRPGTTVISDPSGRIVTAYPRTGPTAVFIHSDGVVGAILHNLHTKRSLSGQLRRLRLPWAPVMTAVTPS